MLNHYQVLEVPFSATLDEIHRAYRRLVKRLHPDIFKKADTPFLQLKAAYETLSNESLRKSYNQLLRDSNQTAIKLAQKIEITREKQGEKAAELSDKIALSPEQAAAGIAIKLPGSQMIRRLPPGLRDGESVAHLIYNEHGEQQMCSFRVKVI